LSPSTIEVSSKGGSFGIKVDAKPDCTWAVEKVPSWIQVDLKSGTGPGGIGFKVESNPGAKRTADIVVGGDSVTVVQAGG
jgi:hypothetical protein